MKESKDEKVYTDNQVAHIMLAKFGLGFVCGIMITLVVVNV